MRANFKERGGDGEGHEAPGVEETVGTREAETEWRPFEFEVEDARGDGYHNCFRRYAEIKQGCKRNKSNSLCCQILRSCFVSLITPFLQPKGMG